MAYTAPESFLAVRCGDGGASACFPAYGPPADCWALGLTAFNLLTGSSLFKSAEDAVPPEEGSDVDLDWEEWRANCIFSLQAEWVGSSPCYTSPRYPCFPPVVSFLIRYGLGCVQRCPLSPA